MTTLSVIVPTLNEGKTLPCLLECLSRQTGVDLEVIVADGGSTDETIRVCRQYGVKVVESTAGRGRQMNAGVVASSGHFVLFLHADTRLTDNGQLAAAVETLVKLQTRPAAGHFSLQFHDVAQRDAGTLQYHEAKTQLNRKNTTNGDQGMLLRREDFGDLGGFDESLHFLEDQDMAERIRAAGVWTTLPSVISTSARRFGAEGLTRRMLQSAAIMAFREIRLPGFFDEALQIYRHQHRIDDPLAMAPFLGLGHGCLASEGPRAFVTRWYGIGRYVRDNAWQLFFAMDVRSQAGPGPWLDWHDRYFDPLTDNTLGNILAMIMAMGTYYFLWWYFLATERA